MGPIPSPHTSQPPPPPPATGKRRGRSPPSPAWRPQSTGRVGDYFPAPPANSPQPPAPPPLTFRPHRLPPTPPRPFVLIPDSAAPAAAAKRTLHFRFRTAPPLSQNRRPSLLPASAPSSAPPPPPRPPRAGRAGNPGGGGASRPCSLVRLSPLPINP